MTTAIGTGPEAPHPSSPRGQAYGVPSRSQSTRSRPPTSSQAAALPPHRAASTSHHHGSRSSSSGRPLQDIISPEEYARDPSNVPSHSKRSSSNDRPPTSSRADPSSRPHRRSSQRSNHSHGPSQQDMAPTGANNPGPHGVADGGRAPSGSAPVRHGRSRTSIPSQSGKWILGKTIGAGSMGKVKLAKKEDSNEQVPLLSPVNSG